jgi:hypothetical protein
MTTPADELDRRLRQLIYSRGGGETWARTAAIRLGNRRLPSATASHAAARALVLQPTGDSMAEPFSAFHVLHSAVRWQPLVG